MVSCDMTTFWFRRPVLAAVFQEKDLGCCCGSRHVTGGRHQCSGDEIAPVIGGMECRSGPGSAFPRDLRTHILRLLGPKTILYIRLLGYFDP